MADSKLIGIVCAEEAEIQHIFEGLETEAVITEIAGRKFHRSTLNGVEIVCVRSFIGKCAASLTTTLLIQEFKPSHVIFIGVAGSLGSECAVGDVVISTSCAQHDVDVRPFRKQCEIPEVGKIFFPADESMINSAVEAAKSICDSIEEIVDRDTLSACSIKVPKVIRGVVATGDQFCASAEKTDAIKAVLPEATCVEMEGAALAYVCHEFNTPFVVVRIMSDGADGTAPGDFGLFMGKVCSPFTAAIAKQLLPKL